MTNEEAIRTLYELGDALELSKDSRAWEAIDMAISALKAECAFVEKESEEEE